MITNTKEYSAEYASDLIRGIDIEARPWDLQQEILNITKTTSTLLDIGSGDSRKVIPLAKHLSHIVAMEPSLEMRKLANNALQHYNLKNITIVNGVADKLPFPDSSFNIVTCSLAPWNISEVYRVLKLDGYFINETIGCADKIEFKKEFGVDEFGVLRGQLIQDPEEHYLSNLRNNIESNLSNVTLKNGFWKTMYTKNGLLELCKVTPTINDFNEIKDKIKFDNAISKLQSPNGIILTQNRVLIIGKKSI